MANAANMLSIVKLVVADIKPQHTPNPAANFMGIPVELRLQILENLLPDVDFIPFRFSYKEAKALEKAKPVTKPACTQCGHWPMPPPPSRYPWQSDSQYWTIPPSDSLSVSSPDLRKDENRCDVRIMRTCKRIYKECHGLLYTRERIFEAAINWDSHLEQNSTMSFLSHHRIPLPKDTSNTYLPPPPMFGPQAEADRNAGDFSTVLAPIASLQLSLPIYRIATSSRQITAFRQLMIRVVDGLVQKSQNNTVPVRKLRIDMLCEYPALPPRANNFWTESPTKENQAQLKWILETFGRLRASPSTELIFMIDGEDICSTSMQDRWDHLYRYTNFLSTSDYEDIEPTESKNLPPHLDKLVGFLKMQDLLVDVHDASLQIDDINAPPTSHWAGLPPSPPMAMMSPCDARTQIWDAWETKDWPELNRQFQAVSDLWTDVKDTLNPNIEEVGDTFRKSGKKAA